MDVKRVRSLVDEALKENESLFLIDLKTGEDNSIRVVVDGDEGVPLSECIRISRHVEHNLNRDEEDFSLEVTSPSITDPIQDKRQFNKNIGRILQLKTDTGSFEGKLTEIVEDQLVLQWKVREPKPIGKGKITVEKKELFPIENISEAKVKIIF
ncbi:MAG: ribosome assembly cofactor RimP [Lutimonas sp.]